MAVAIVVQKAAAGAPTAFRLLQARLFRNVGESSISVVVDKNVVSPESAEEVVPAVVFVIAHAKPSLPSTAADARLIRDVCEGPVSIVLEEVGRGCGPGGPLRVEPAAVCEIDVEPANDVVLENRDAAPFRLDDHAFMFNTAPDIWNCESRLFRHINELHGRGWARSDGGLS